MIKVLKHTLYRVYFAGFVTKSKVFVTFLIS
jgi:hypothetical protein